MADDAGGPAAAGQVVALQDEVGVLRRRLTEAEETLAAIRGGEADALVLQGEEGPHIQTLYGADYTYRMVVETMLEGAVIVDRGGAISYCNHAFAELLRAPLERVVGSFLDGWCHPEDLAALQRLLGSAAVRGTEFRLRRSDGGAVCVLATSSTLTSGRRPLSCLVLTDITVQQRQHRQLQAEEQLARSILEQAGDGIVVCDGDGLIMRASREACRLAGEPVVGRSFDQAFPLCQHDSAGGGLPRLWREPLARGELSLARPSGGSVPVLVSVAPLTVAAHGLPGSVVTLTDLSAGSAARTNVEA